VLYDSLLLVAAHGFPGAAEVREARAPARSANAEAIGRMVEDEEPEFRAAVIFDAELDRLIAHLGTNPLAEAEVRLVAEAEVRLVAEGVYVSLSQSQPAGLD
jgi:hypothetical protein